MSSDATDTPRVYLDVMLGALATVLRMAGWDTAYALDRGLEADAAILDDATTEDRVVVTRDRQLAERAPESVLLTTLNTENQVAELRDAGYVVAFDEPTRCSTCNGRLVHVGTDDATPDDAPDPADEAVWRCRDCGQHFWKGSHWDDVVARLGVD